MLILKETKHYGLMNGVPTALVPWIWTHWIIPLNSYKKVIKHGTVWRNSQNTKKIEKNLRQKKYVYILLKICLKCICKWHMTMKNLYVYMVLFISENLDLFIWFVICFFKGVFFVNFCFLDSLGYTFGAMYFGHFGI